MEFIGMGRKRLYLLRYNMSNPHFTHVYREEKEEFRCVLQAENYAFPYSLYVMIYGEKKQGKNRVRLYTQMLVRITKRKEASKFIGKLFSESSVEILTWIGGEFPL